MPDYMAEQVISYEELKKMEDTDPTFRQTAVVFAIGANDVVSLPGQGTDPHSHYRNAHS